MDLNLVLAVLSVIMFAGLVAFFAFLVRHQAEVEPERETYGVELLEQHYAPGDTVEQPTPYFVSPIPASPDPLEISANLDKKILIGGLMLFAIVGMIGVYFVIQGEFIPGVGGIRAAAVEHQLALDVRRGKTLYATLCYDCHGRDGQGGTTPDGEQLPGLPLNNPAYQHANIADDPARLEEVRRLIVTTIERGREFPAPRYSMPAWHREEGGPLGDWQIKQLADLIMYGTEEDWADMPHLRTEHAMALEEQIPAPPAVPSGEELALQVCSTCHSFDSNVASINPLAPNLAAFAETGPTIAELRAAQGSGDPDWLLKWITNPSSIKPGSQMPPYGASAGGQVPDDKIPSLVDFLLGREEAEE
ncbi:MAG: c-type cytochrome [Candidatus Limnocylindria bacterium]